MGTPELPIMYICVNMTWNICLLILLKLDGAFYTFLAGALVLPIAESMFNIDWPLLPATPFSWFQIGGLVIILGGIVLYRGVTMWKERREAAERAAADNK